MLDSWWLLILLPLAALSGWLIGRPGDRARQSLQQSLKLLPPAYYRGLNFLLNEQSDNAVDALQAAINEQENSIEVQLALGNVYRRRGEIEKATGLHQNLISHTRADPQLYALAVYELAQDYQKAGLLDRAEDLYLDLAEGEHQNSAACEHLLQIYEQEKEWEHAIYVIDRYCKQPQPQHQQQKSHYYCELAEIAITEGRYEQALDLIRKALLSDPDNLRAIIQSGRVDAARGDHAGAIRQWQQVIEKNSLYVREVIELIANSFRALGDEKGLNAYLRQTIEKHKSARAILLLTENLMHSSGARSAEDQLAGWLRKNPSLSGVRKLLEMKMSDSGLSATNKRDMILLSRLLDSVIDTQSRYQCRLCGFSGRNFYWQCPSCRTWSSISAQRQLLGNPDPGELGG